MYFVSTFHPTKPPKLNELGAAFVSERRRANARSLNSRITIASKVVNALRGNLIVVMRVVCYAKTFYLQDPLANFGDQLEDSRTQEGKKRPAVVLFDKVFAAMLPGSSCLPADYFGY
jgi:hypothetical protein